MGNGHLGASNGDLDGDSGRLCFRRGDDDDELVSQKRAQGDIGRVVRARLQWCGPPNDPQVTVQDEAGDDL